MESTTNWDWVVNVCSHKEPMHLGKWSPESFEKNSVCEKIVSLFGKRPFKTLLCVVTLLCYFPVIVCAVFVLISVLLTASDAQSWWAPSNLWQLMVPRVTVHVWQKTNKQTIKVSPSCWGEKIKSRFSSVFFIGW